MHNNVYNNVIATTIHIVYDVTHGLTALGVPSQHQQREHMTISNDYNIFGH